MTEIFCKRCDLTPPIGRDNGNIRYFLARFQRRTKVISKSLDLVDDRLRLHHHGHGNPQNQKDLCIKFQSIFA